MKRRLEAPPGASYNQPSKKAATGELPKVQDALGYLEKVKNRFGQEPQVYNQFLDIMKDFKSQAIDTEGVIKRVKELFAGDVMLIMGFNQFLPPGIFAPNFYNFSNFSGSPPPSRFAQSSCIYQALFYTINTCLTPRSSIGLTHVITLSRSFFPDYKIELEEAQQCGRPAHATPAVHVPATAPVPTPAVTPVVATPTQSSGSATKTKPTIEFNHAVQYVAKVKHIFKDDPEVYSEFLDILHDYQAKRTIDEVYERVQKLFGDQPELLEEFKYFLPDDNVPSTKSRGKTTKRAAPISGGTIASTSATAASHRDPRLEDARAAGVKPPEPTAPDGCEEQVRLFDQIKGVASRSQWSQLMKCLNMYSLGLCTRDELMRLIADFLPSKHDMPAQFMKVMGFDENIDPRNSYADLRARPDAIQQCNRPTPSYRQFPSNTRLPECNGRDELGNSVLNDRYFSTPSTTLTKPSEQSPQDRVLVMSSKTARDWHAYNFRANSYEDNMFGAEDQRIALDTMIYTNAATMRVLESFGKALTTETDDETTKYLHALQYVRSKNTSFNTFAVSKHSFTCPLTHSIFSSAR